MLFSTPTQYAIRALSEMALRSGPSGMMLSALVKDTDLPKEFVAKLFQQLVKAGILTSSKGRGGGFALARPAHDISLLQISEAIDGAGAIDGCVLGLEQCSDTARCPQHDLYKPIRQRLRDYLSSTTLADLSASAKAR